MRHTIFYTLCTVLLVLGLAGGCARGETDQILNVALSGAPETLDPHATTSTLTFQVLRSTYDTLLEPDSTGGLVGALATTWEYNPDGTELTFTLRDGVQFHDGTPLGGADVAASLERMRSAGAPRAADYAPITDVSVAGDNRVTITLAAPAPALLATLASGWSAILPAAAIARAHDFAAHPLGTGPFVFDTWVVGNSIIFSKNENYWQRGAPHLAGVTFHIITENVIRVQGILNGSIDVVDIVDPSDLPGLREHPGAAVAEDLSSLAMVVAMNTRRAPLNNVRVREALNAAVDKQEILDRAYGGGVPINTFMDYGDPYYPDIPDKYTHNPASVAEAKSVIAASGAGANPLTMVLPQNFEPHVRAGEIYQQQLAAVGITVNLKLVDWPTWIDQVYLNSNYDLTVIGHTGHLDPSPRFDEIAYTGWENPRFASLTAAGAAEVDPATRTQVYADALAILADEVPFIFVGTNYRYIVTGSSVSGVVVDSKLDSFDFRQTRK